MALIKTAVIGVGYLGKYHAEKYASLPNTQLIAVCDTNTQRCSNIARALGVEAVTDYRDLIGKVEAVSIVVPTTFHHVVGHFFLSHGVHVLIEKPITTTLEEANDLILMAKKKKAILQVGHLERFNTALQAARPFISQPLFIEARRSAPFQLRGSDVNVILDLMIHDIDLIQSIVPAPIRHVSAQGFSVLTSDIDTANVRLEFENGCVATLIANRAHSTTERKLSIFQSDHHLQLDLQHKTLAIHRKGSREAFPGIPEITVETQSLEQGDALKAEIAAFLEAIHLQQQPLISGESGKQALMTALAITQAVNQHNERHASFQPA